MSTLRGWDYQAPSEIEGGDQVVSLIDNLISGDVGEYRSLLTGEGRPGLFERGVAEPARRELERETIPSIRESMSAGAYGGGYHSGAARELEANARRDTADTVAGLRYQDYRQGQQIQLQAQQVLSQFANTLATIEKGGHGAAWIPPRPQPQDTGPSLSERRHELDMLREQGRQTERWADRFQSTSGGGSQQMTEMLERGRAQLRGHSSSYRGAAPGSESAAEAMSHWNLRGEGGDSSSSSSSRSSIPSSGPNTGSGANTGSLLLELNSPSNQARLNSQETGRSIVDSLYLPTSLKDAANRYIGGGDTTTPSREALSKSIRKSLSSNYWR